MTRPPADTCQPGDEQSVRTPSRSSPSGPADLPPTRASLAGQLRALGLGTGDAVLVHASLRAMGWVCGGATAVVQALLDVLGPTGTLTVPTFTSDNRDPSCWRDRPVPAHWWPTIRRELPAFDPDITPGQHMGAISEQVRTWPGARRSGHPQVSFAAVGAHAEHVVAVHDLDCHLGERSPLRALEDLDAWVLLLGVGFERCTAFHLGEYRQPNPPVREYSCALAGPRGRTWATFVDVDLDQRDFDRIGAAFEAGDAGDDTSGGSARGRIRRGRLGLADARFFPLRSAVRHATQWLREHR